MKSYIGLFIGLLLSVSVSAEPLLEGRVRLSSGQPVAGVQVRLFDLTDLHQSVSTTTDQTGHFTLSLQAFAPGTVLPQGFALGQNYPNPFNPSTIIPYQIPTAAHVRLEVFNLLGQRIATLVDSEQAAGAHTATWTATDATGQAVGAGVYIYRLVSGSATVSRRMVLIDGQAGTPAAGAASVLPGVSGDGAGQQTYGLVVAGQGIAPYVVRDFRVVAGMAPVEVVVEAQPHDARFDDFQDDLAEAAPAPAGKAVAAPAAPTNLRVEAVTDSSCTVRWDAAEAATDYDINYRKVQGGRWTNWTHRGVRLYNTIRDLEPGTEYRWAVRAENSDGRSEWVFGPNFTTLADETDGTTEEEEADGQAPAAPTNLRFDAPTDSSCTVRWDAAAGATDYDVNYRPAVGGRWTNWTHRGTGLYTTINDLEPKTEYRWAVRAENSVGRSEWVFGPNFTTNGLPGPDLIVQLPSVSDNTLTPGQAFTLSATVQNQGDQPAAATTVRYYRSNNATITASDTQVGTDAVGALTAAATHAGSIALTAPMEALTYFYGACVDPVADESNPDNNCSTAVRVTVEASGTGETPPEEAVTSDEQDEGGFVTIPDPNLRLLIEAYLSLEPERGGAGRQKARGAPILRAEMEKLRQLAYSSYGVVPSAFGLSRTEADQIHESGIKDLTGIEHATNLESFSLRNIDLSEVDLSPLAGLSKLSSVNLNNTKISDLSPLVGLRLSWAYFSFNKISDIAPLLKIIHSRSNVYLYSNPLSRESINTHIPALRNMGVTVEFSLQVSSQQIYNDNVFVLPIAEDLAAGNLPLTDYSAHFYEHFSDEFDFLIFIPNLTQYQAGRSDWANRNFYQGVSNDLKGIGEGQYFSSEYGSAQRLKGVIWFSQITTDPFPFPPEQVGYRDDGSIYQPHTQLYEGPFLHEVMHRWANYIIEPTAHWTWNSANGILGGFDIATLVDHGDGRYSANGSVPGYNGFSNGGWAGNYIPYSPIELYLAGLIPPEEVPDLWVAGAECIGVVDEDGYWDYKSFITHQARTYTIEDIIAEHGPRIPDHTQSQKNFRAAVILLISEDYPTDTRMLDLLSEEVSFMSHAGYDQNDEFYNFYEATGGRATITMDGLSSLKRQGAAKRLVPSSYGTPPPIVECEIDHHGLLQPHIH